MTDDDLRRALAPYREVEASDRLRQAVIGPEGPPAKRPARRQLTAGGVIAGLAVAAAAIAAVTRDSPDPDDREAASRPIDVSDAREVVFGDGLTVSLDELFDASQHDRLKAVFRDHGVELSIHEVPVNTAADGRVFTVSVQADGEEMSSTGVYRLEPGARVDITVGRGEATAGEAGLTLYEVFPQIEAAVDRDDPAATGSALAALGFQVHWVLIEGPGEGHDVEAPPPGTVVVSVLGPEGEWTSIDPATDTLMVELATPDVAEDLGH